MNIKGNITGAATGVLIGIGKDLLAALAPQVYAAFEEWNEERKTPDGWTEFEYLTFLIGAIGDVKAKSIGPKWVDYVGDLGLASLQMTLAKRRDKLTEAPAPPVDPTDPHPPPKPVEKPYYGKMLEARPSAADPMYNTAEDKVWWNQATNPIAERFIVTSVSATVLFSGWDVTSWAE